MQGGSSLIVEAPMVIGAMGLKQEVMQALFHWVISKRHGGHVSVTRAVLG